MKISTNKLAKELKLEKQELFDKLLKLKLIDSNRRLTKLGIKYGKEQEYLGNKYISWNDRDIIIKIIDKKKSFFDKIVDIVSDKPKSEVSTKVKTQNIDPRKLYKAEHRTDDGHYVRSKAEVIIDNWLYNKGIVHAYEKRVPIKENLLSDFYIPQGKVYIEFWGYENKPEYLKRKKVKQNIYKKYNLNLIELTDKEVQNLDDILPRILLKFGIKIF
jgi:hypothetical protein